MDFKSFLLIAFIVVSNVSSEFSVNSKMKEQCPSDKTSLVSVRKRRHLAFQPGSAVSLTTSVVKTFMTHAPSGWFVVVEFEMVWMLPDPKVVAAHNRKKLHHRQKKEIWEIIENAMEQRNMNGRSCIIRTICEAQMSLLPKGKSLVHDILRAMFTSRSSYPKQLKEMFQKCMKPGPALCTLYVNIAKKYSNRFIATHPCVSCPWLAVADPSYVSIQNEVAPLQEHEFVEEMGLTYSELLEPDFCMKANDCPLSILDLLLDLNRMR